MRGAALAVILVAVAACAHAPDACEAFGAAHRGHSSAVFVTSPYRLRELYGRFYVGSTDSNLGPEWATDEYGLSFDVLTPEGGEVHVPIGRDGRFRATGLPPGRYCFRASSTAFETVAGSFIISSRAPEAAALDVVLHLPV